MNIFAAIFDIGNVLLSFDYELFFSRVETGRAGPDARRELIALRESYEIGRIGREDFIRAARGVFLHEAGDTDFVEAWEDIFELNTEILPLVEDLSARMPLFLLSNTNCIHRESIERRYPVFSRFRDGVYSYEARLLKPSPEIFHLAAARFGVEPSRTLYLDDMPDNVAAARRTGFRAVQYERSRHAECEAEIARLLAGGNPVSAVLDRNV